MSMKKNNSRIKTLSILILTILMVFNVSGNGFVKYQVKAYAALPALTEVNKANYYGRSRLATMANSANLLYAYDKIAAGVEKYEAKIEFTDASRRITKEQLKIVTSAYANDYPQHFWRGTGYSYSYNSSDSKIISLSYSYIISKGQLASAKSAFNSAVASIISGIDASMSEFERELLIHDRLANKITYVDTGDKSHSAYGALVDGKAVCEGYSRAFQYALYKVGILSSNIEGQAGGGHAWNMVKIDNGYYYVDLTWDDQSTKTYHAYFNLSYSEMSRDHKPDMPYYIPTTNYTQANYFKVMNLYLFSALTVDNVVKALNKDLTADMYFYCNTDNFWPWVQSNINTIINRLGITGSVSYGYSTCGNEKILTLSGDRSTVKATGVSMNYSTYTLTDVGKQVKLTATVLPSNANNKTVTYRTTNKNVVTVNKYTGLVTAVGLGSASIIATSEDGNRTAQCVITVSDQNIAVTGLSLNKTSAVLTTCGKTQLVPIIAPANATNKSIIWSTSNSSVATVSSTGVVTGVGQGSATITAKTRDGLKTAVCKVTVKNPSVSYTTHVQKIGWQSYVKDGAMAGTAGKALRLEGIKIKLDSASISGGISYRTHVQTYGWMGFVSNNNLSGTTGQAKRLEAIEIKLTGDIANYYDVYYRVHAQTYGWLGWAKNGAPAGTAGYAKRLEAIEIRLVKKGGAAPGSTKNCYISK